METATATASEHVAFVVHLTAEDVSGLKRLPVKLKTARKPVLMQLGTLAVESRDFRLSIHVGIEHYGQ